MSLATLALYKGPGVFPGSHLIRFWTKSPYSHCELVIGGECFSSSLMDGGVRQKQISLTSDKWDLIALPWANAADVLLYFAKTKGQRYDWWGLIGSQVFNRRSEAPGAAFCSEWCAAALGLPNPETYSPQTLGDQCIFLNSRR